MDLHDPGNDRVIDELYVFMSIDAHGRHGVVAGILPGLGATPFVTGSPKMAEFFKPTAEKIARESGKKIGLFAFKRGDMAWSIDPRQ